MISIVLTARNDPLLWWTVGNIWETVELDTEIVIVDDATVPQDRYYAAELETVIAVRPPGHRIRLIRNDKPQGVGRSRDIGIVEATHDCVIVADSHIAFPRGWDEIALQHYANNRTRIYCTACARLNPDQLNLDHAPRPYELGARIVTHQITSGGQKRIWQGVWDRTEEKRQAWENHEESWTHCPMGGCYMLSRRHYIATLKRPWHYCYGWGCGEPILAMVQAGMGFDCGILPIVTGHVFRNPEEAKPKAERRLLWSGTFAWANANQFYANKLAHDDITAEAEHANKAHQPSPPEWREIHNHWEKVGLANFLAWFHANKTQNPLDYVTGYKQGYKQG